MTPTSGRPTRSRDKLRNNFLFALAEDFTAYGVEAIQQARGKDPLGYIKVCASLMPKEIELKAPLDELSDEQLAAAALTIRTILNAQSNRSDPESAGVAESAEELQAVSKAG